MPRGIEINHEPPRIAPRPTDPGTGVRDPIWEQHGREIARRNREEAIAHISATYKAAGSGSEIGLLGLPIGEPTQLTETHFEQKYQFGTITSKTVGDDNRRLADVVVTVVDIDIASVHCFGTDDPGGFLKPAADEPYLVIVAVSPGDAFLGQDNIATTWRSSVYTGIEPHADFCTEVQAFQALPAGNYGIYLKVILMEQEEGDPESVRQKIKEKADAVARDVKKAASVLLSDSDVGNAVGDSNLDSGILDTLGDLTLDALTGILQDDVIGTKELRLKPAWLEDLCAPGQYEGSRVPYPTTELPAHIFANFPYGVDVMTPFYLYSNDDASYKVYFDVKPRKITFQR